MREVSEEFAGGRTELKVIGYKFAVNDRGASPRAALQKLAALGIMME
jgi:hypothetical protein